MLMIVLQVPHPTKTGEFKEIYRNSVEVNSSVAIPYERLVETFKFLYPQKGLIVNFRIL